MTRRCQPLCYLCRHYFSEKYKSKAKPGLFPYGEFEWPAHEYCAAYPDDYGIPDFLIINGHQKPYEGDHGIQFEPKEDLSPELVENMREIYSPDKPPAKYRSLQSYIQEMSNDSD